MCESQITIKKFLKLFIEIEFYRIVIFIIFLLTRYEMFSIKMFAKAVFPFFDVSTGFVSCFLLFYLCIPFINQLLHALSEKEHVLLIAWSLFVYTILPSFFKANVAFNYITWFSVIYVIAAYIRMYPKSIFNNQKVIALAMGSSILLSGMSILVLAYLSRIFGKGIWMSMFFVNDSNKILALTTALFSFLFFKNLKIGYYKWINTISASTFGVLLIHASSDTMRRWLWKDIGKNTVWYETKYWFVHAVLYVAIIYIVCTIIDMCRISLWKKIEKFKRK